MSFWHKTKPRTKAGSLQEWYDQRVAVFAEPDETVETIKGRDWARVRPLRCPWCKRVFYAWTPLDIPLAPCAEDEMPVNGRGTRRTCGHPLCWESEDKHQFRTRLAAKATTAITKGTR